MTNADGSTLLVRLYSGSFKTVQQENEDKQDFIPGVDTLLDRWQKAYSKM